MAEDLNDRDLIRRTAEGELEAFAELYRRYKKPLLNYLFKYLNDYQTAEDVFHDTFVDSYRLLREGKYREKDRFASWIFTVATHIANKYIRRRKRLELTIDGNAIDEGEIDKAELIEDRSAERADTKAAEDERQELLRRLFARLPKRQRQVMILHVVKGMKYKDVARALSVSVGAVGVWVQRARKALLSMKSDGM